MLQRAAVTDALPATDKTRMSLVVLERRDALLLLDEMREAYETATREFIGLESRVFEIATLLVRGPNGHEWLKSLSELDRATASEIYQKFNALARHLMLRSKAAQVINGNGNGNGGRGNV